MRIVAIIQARVASTRLPSKVLLPLGSDVILGQVVKRVRYAKNVDEVIVATSVRPMDDPIVGFCLLRGYSYYRGSELDVLERYYQAACQAKADVIIRITSDCPLIDSELLDNMIDFYWMHQQIDYLSNTLFRTYPRGLDIEIFKFSALEKAHFEAKFPDEREHVTPYIRNHPNTFQLENYQAVKDYSSHRWTLDTLEDYNFFTEIAKNLNILESGMSEVLRFLEKNQQILLLNKHIEQKLEVS